ncbi:hypothetical protein [Prosthecochloris sp.]|uniref:hypothetical protein n=1 Tax=Prosthecochloris sp. TaxID=290513 RepID=UPI0025ECDC09|nr:hypothetical protein [Prosthecochloris sp.]
MTELPVIKSNNQPSVFHKDRYRFNISQVSVSDPETGETRDEWQYNEIQVPFCVDDLTTQQKKHLAYVHIVTAYIAKKYPFPEELAMQRKAIAGIDNDGVFNAYNADVENIKTQVKNDLNY